MNIEKIDKTLDLLFETWFSLSTKDSSIKKLFELEDYFLGDEVYNLQEVILFYIGVPEDNYLDYYSGKNGRTIEIKEEDMFCRDWQHDQFYNCGIGKITLGELKKILLDDVDDE